MHQSERDCPERKVPKKKKKEREANAGQAPTTSVGQRWGVGAVRSVWQVHIPGMETAVSVHGVLVKLDK